MWPLLPDHSCVWTDNDSTEMDWFVSSFSLPLKPLTGTELEEIHDSLSWTLLKRAGGAFLQVKKEKKTNTANDCFTLKWIVLWRGLIYWTSMRQGVTSLYEVPSSLSLTTSLFAIECKCTCWCYECSNVLMFLHLGPLESGTWICSSLKLLALLFSFRLFIWLYNVKCTNKWFF